VTIWFKFSLILLITIKKEKKNTNGFYFLFISKGFVGASKSEKKIRFFIFIFLNFIERILQEFSGKEKCDLLI